MPVVSNASPLISLAAIDHLALVERLYTQIVVPEAVYAEVVLAGQGRPGADAMVTSPWITVRPVQDAVLVTRLRRQVNIGEAEAIALAVETHAELLLLDERRARALARQFALPVIGVVGVLLEAKQRGLVPAVKPLLDDLLARAGYRLSAGLYREALLLAQE